MTGSQSGAQCGCCGWSGGAAHGRGTLRLPGDSLLPMQRPTHGKTLRAMMERLSRGSPALAALTTRDPGDPALALLDAWACVAEVLGFNSQQIALEHYVETATERWSLERLAELLGHVPRPGVAASTALVFVLDDSAAAAKTVSIPVGTRVQSVPEPGQTAQTFETSVAFTARPEWNAIPVRRIRRLPMAGATECWVVGTATQLAVGDTVLFIRAAATGQGAPATTDWQHVVLIEVTADSAADRTLIRWQEALPATWGSDDVEAHAFRSSAALLGHNTKSGGDQVASNATSFILDAVYRGVAPGQWALAERDGARLLRRVQSTSLASAVLPGTETAARGTRLRFANAVGSSLKPSETTVFVRSERLELAQSPWTDPVEGDSIELAAGNLPPEIDALVAIEELPPKDADIGVAPPRAHVARVTAISSSAAGASLSIEPALGSPFVRGRTVVRANVVPATHGESSSEILGRGDAGSAFQAFLIRQSPLTHVAADSDSGARSTLSVRVGEMDWSEVPTLVDRAQEEQVFATRLATEPDSQGQVVVQFGDGAGNGPRLPSGVTVVATLRRGLGLAGNLGAGQIRLPIAAPLGVRSAFNAGPSAGGADPESAESLREAIPSGVLTLGRIVSLRDHEDFARNFTGVAKAGATWGWVGGAGQPLRRAVLLTVAGPAGAVIHANHPTRRALREAIARAGEPHLLVELLAHRPVKLSVKGSVRIDRRYEAGAVLALVQSALGKALGFDGRRLGARLFVSEIVAAIHGVPGVLAVDLDSITRLPAGPGGQVQYKIPGNPGKPTAMVPARQAEIVGGTLLGAELLTLADQGLALEVRP